MEPPLLGWWYYAGVAYEFGLMFVVVVVIAIDLWRDHLQR